jgi:DNA-binding IclR family transcriptional regulator
MPARAPAATDGESDGGERSRSIARVLSALEELSVASSPLSNHDLAARLGVPSASMYRLLQKLAELGYVEYSSANGTYAVAPRLADLAERLTDAGCRAPPLRRLMDALRAEAGEQIAIWVRSSVNVRIAALLAWDVRSSATNSFRELPPFSTPGLAIAAQYGRQELRALIARTRRRGLPFGRRFTGIADIEKQLRDVRARGFVAGYNLRADGWGILAWPVAVSASPRRIGALTIAAPVASLRGDEARLVQRAQALIANYHHEQGIGLEAAP